MHAVVLHEFGPAENLRYQEVPDPVPGEGEVLIRVRAAGAHQIETAMREGLAIGPPLPELPAVFGGEAAGVVEAVGAGVDSGWVGARVAAGSGRTGGYAELTVAPVAEVRRIPEHLGFEAAATMIGTGTTTMEFLDHAALTAQDTVLVTSAAGGVGRLLVQHARNLGATVVGVAGGPEKTEAVRELGPTAAVDYTRPDWAAEVRAALGGRGVTAVLDGVGGDIARAAFDLLEPGGRFVSLGSSSRDDFEPAEAELKSREVEFVHALLRILEAGPTPDAPDRALAAAADGSLVPAYQTFPLAEAARAHRDMERRATTGKVLLVP